MGLFGLGSKGAEAAGGGILAGLALWLARLGGKRAGKEDAVQDEAKQAAKEGDAQRLYDIIKGQR